MQFSKSSLQYSVAFLSMVASAFASSDAIYQDVVSGPATVNTSACSTYSYSRIVIASGKVAQGLPGNRQVVLSQTGDGQFYSDSACTTPASYVVLGSNIANVNFYYKDTLAESVVISATITNSNNLPGSENVKIQNNSQATQLSISSNSQTLQAGVCSAAGQFQALTAAGSKANFANSTSVGLSSSSVGAVLSFFADSKCSQAITSVGVAAGSGSGSFYFTSKINGSATLTVSANGLSPASQSETIQVGAANQLILTTQPSNTISGAAISPPPALESRTTSSHDRSMAFPSPVRIDSG